MGGDNKNLARYLRNNSQPPEVLLWLHLRGRQTGHLINRQYRIGPYIVDFYCRKLKVVIEIDGKVHGRKRAKDEARDEWMSNQGIFVIRFPASHVYRSAHTASLRVKDILDQRKLELSDDN